MNTHEIRLMNIYEIYNFSLINYNEISSKKNLFVLKQTLRMLNENIIMNNFHLHYFY